jgi:hypothetical protein
VFAAKFCSITLKRSTMLLMIAQASCTCFGLMRQIEAEELEIVADKRPVADGPRVGISVQHETRAWRDGADVVDEPDVARPQQRQHGLEVRLDVEGDVSGVVRVGVAEADLVEQAPKLAQNVVAASREQEVADAAGAEKRRVLAPRQHALERVARLGEIDDVVAVVLEDVNRGLDERMRKP